MFDRVPQSLALGDMVLRRRLIAKARATIALIAWLVFAAGSNAAWADVQYAYDAAGRLTVVYAPNGDAAQYVYDAAGNITQINRFTAATLSVIEFSPASGPIGATVTIYGTGFNATPSANTVKFNGTTTTVSSGGTTQLVVTVPAGATTGPISVTNGANTAASSRSFTVTGTGPPTITGFTPTIGTTGTPVTISGTNFDPPVTVRFNVTPALVTSITTTTLSTIVPGAAASGKIKVVTPLGAATSAADFIVPPAPYTAADIGMTGRIVVDGSTLPVNITTAGKVALILFDGIGGQNIGVGISGVSLTPSGSTATVSVLNTNGTKLLSGTIFSAAASLDLPPLPVTGTYTIMIVPSGAAQLNATLTVSSDLSGAFASPGAVMTFDTARVGQNGRYTFTGFGGNQTITVSNDTIASTKIEVRAPNGTVVASSTVGATGGTIPAPLLQAWGTYTVFVSPVADNVGKLDMQITWPDLTISDASVGVITLNHDGSYTIPVTFTVRNIGGTTAGPNWRDMLYLSKDAILDDNDLAFHYLTYGGVLAVNGSNTWNGFYPTPTDVEPGPYTLFIKTDGHGGVLGGQNTDAGNVAELDETNNTRSFSIVLPPKPDLTLSGGAVGTITVHENGSYIIPVTFTVTNIGGATASPSWFDVGYLSKNTTLDDNAVLTGNTTHDTALAPNASYVVNATHGAPIVTTSGTYTLFLKADGRSPILDNGKNTDSGHVAEANETNNVQALTIVLPGKPDLTITGASVGAITLNQDGSYTIPATYTVKNVGQLTANVDDYSGGWWDIGYISDDGVLDANDPRISGVPGDVYHPGPYHNTPLPAGASYTTTTTYITPTTATPGARTLFIKANGSPYGATYTGPLAEEDWANNTVALAITLPGKPDLTVTSASVGAVTVKRDGSYSFPLTYTVKNIGASAAQPYWYDQTFLSSNGSLDINSVYLNSVSNHATVLAAGASYTVTGATVFTSTTTTSGTYTVFVKTDANGSGTGSGYISEADETNNARSVPITLPVKPDLTVTSASIGTMTITGSNYNVPVTFTVKNAGATTAQPSWSDLAYLSKDGVLGNAVPLSAASSATSHTTALAAGASYTKTVTYTAPTTNPPGGYTLFIKADGDSVPTGSGVLGEGNETNNTQALAITLPAQLPDLTVSSLTVGTMTVAQSGAYSVPVTYKVTNSGFASAPPSWYDVGYLSNNGVLDGAPVLAGYRQRTTALAAGASYSINATFTTDPTTNPGAYTLFLKADGRGGALGGSNTDSGSVAEANETNNTRALPVTLPNKPDLTMTIVSVGTIVKNTNGSYKIPVTYKVTNVGGAAAQPSWYDVAYLSDDATLDINDAALAGYHTQAAALAVNGSYTINGTFTTSTTTPAGTHTLFVKADGRSTALGGANTDAGKVMEATETNNTASISVVLQP
jgi:YD repeat-containing protein